MKLDKELNRRYLEDKLGHYIKSKGGDLDLTKNQPQQISCIFKEHKDDTPSFTYYPRRDEPASPTHYHCYGGSCKRHGDIFDLIGYFEGIEGDSERYKRAMELYGTYLDNSEGTCQIDGSVETHATTTGEEVLTEAQKKTSEKAMKKMAVARRLFAKKPDEAVKYIAERGLDYDFCISKGVGYLPGRILFSGKDFYIARYIPPLREKQPKCKMSNKSITGIFNENYLREDNEDVLFLVEGFFDLLSVEQAGYKAMAFSPCFTKKFLKLVDCTEIVILQKKLFILSMDNDRIEPGSSEEGTGQEANHYLLKELTKRGLRAVIVNIAGTGPNDPKDANEALLIKGADNFKEQLRDVILKARDTPFLGEISKQVSTKGCSDCGNALRFVARFGDKVRYCNEWDTWFIYDGKRWNEDRRLEVQDMAKSIALGIYNEAAEALTLEKRAKLAKHALHSESAYSIKEMLKLVASDPNIAITHDSFDEDRWLLNVENGTINLKTGELLPHNEKHLLTKLAPVKYDPNASSELWRNFLGDVTGNNEEFESFLQKAVGYSMTGDTSEEVLFFIYGPTATGKSTFLDAVKSVLGDYNNIANFESFLHHDKGSSHSDDIAALEGARMVVSVEVNEGKRLAEGLVKQITSGDPIPCRRIYGRSYTYYPQMKLWLAANHKPRVSAEDGAMWRRILTLPFDKTVPEDRRDKTLKKKLKNTEAVGPAILTWMVQGCTRWQQEGLNPPSVVKEATQGYRKSQDIIGEFIGDTIEFCNMETLSRSSVYQEYKNWCEKNGERAATNTMLTQKLHERGWKDAGRIRDEWHFDGVRLKDKIINLPQSSDASDIDLGYPTQEQLDNQVKELLGHDL